MRKIAYILSFIFLGAAFQSCTKNFEETNRNNNKVYSVDANDIFAGTVVRTMKLIQELNFNKLMNFSRYAVVGFATNPSQDIGDNYFSQFYVGILRDLLKLEKDYAGKPEYANRLAIVKTWKSYVFYMMASIYGSVPMSDALSVAGENKINFKYDSEQEIYTQVLNDLKNAGDLYSSSATYPNDLIQRDPVFGGATFGKSNLVKWQKFTNTLRLNVAMHVQNISMDLAREHATAVMNDDSKLISSLDEMVKLQWGSDESLSASYYYTRFIKNVTTFSEMTYPALGEYFSTYLFSYNDPRIGAYAMKANVMAPAGTRPMLYSDTLTRAHLKFCTLKDCPTFAAHQADGKNASRVDSILVEYAMPYVPLPELNSLAAGWEWAFVPGQTYRYNDPLGSKNSPYNFSFVHTDFVKENASMVLLNWADTYFLKAEAEMLFGSEGKAQLYYEQGVKASFAQYNLGGVDNYLAQNGIKWNTDGKGFADRRLLYRASIRGKGGRDNHLEQIYKQRYIADYLNCLEGWNLERRTRALRFPPFLANGGSSDVEGYNSVYNYWTERFVYPIVEQSKNTESYYNGIENLKAVSPYYRGDRWGDNVYTSLGFAKLNPDLIFAERIYGGNKIIKPNCEYFNKKYGKTYEEVVVTAKAMTGETDENIALTKAFSYNFRSLLKTYIP
ncbi:SusD/RagB family nutrient-binding outer membrane lipoprotein [Pedobacter hiemivivus]|uniref:SusD/RagB family nutrient-binding outer membrane lipoprotein n=1 Tax=Pedobacter hiemivivus TaxID=2530454 RepID=A0A4R0NGD1_9SPHI|nr:SusD/RagB family nutrient-binding outer membrane lipoprotein [Pedobacter hiemivivus]TCC99581.1 SusD/RagB family nutrient-binding outer membrane lipoprotein [Pedobacter hiemivivus]